MTMQTQTGDIALNKLWCGLQTVSLRINSLAADNTKIKEIFLKRVLIG
jgi:hypothetical protein